MTPVPLHLLRAYATRIAEIFVLDGWMQGKVVPDEYDERSYCLYDTDASTVYGVSAFFVLLLQQAIVTAATRCLCFGPLLSSRGCAVTAFVLSWYVS